MQPVHNRGLKVGQVVVSQMNSNRLLEHYGALNSSSSLAL